MNQQVLISLLQPMVKLINKPIVSAFF